MAALDYWLEFRAFLFYYKLFQKEIMRTPVGGCLQRLESWFIKVKNGAENLNASGTVSQEPCQQFLRQGCNLYSLIISKIIIQFQHNYQWFLNYLKLLCNKVAANHTAIFILIN